MPVPDSITPFYAYRSWDYVDVRLTPVFHGRDSWGPGDIIGAKCLLPRRDADPPCNGVGCTCGIYAAKELMGVPHAAVVGIVALWGTVIEAENGFRAQFAYPKILVVDKGSVGWGKSVEKFRAAWNAAGVPTHVKKFWTPDDLKMKAFLYPRMCMLQRGKSVTAADVTWQKMVRGEMGDIY